MELVCHVEGWPEPRVEWRRDGVVTTQGVNNKGNRYLYRVMSPIF